MKKGIFFLMFMVLCVATMISDTTDVNANGKCEVEFSFDGLQAIAFGDSNKVTDGILDVHHHTPKLEIKQIEKGKEKVIFNAEGKDLYKKVLDVAVPNNTHKPTRYYSADMNKDATDFRWCLDMESDLFQNQLYLKEDKMFCKVNFLGGQFFAAQLTTDKYQFVSGSKIHSFNRQIGRPAANIALEANNNLVISGLDKEISLPYQAGVSYKISITNLPPLDMASVDHFAFYYDMVKSSVTKYVPVMVKKATFVPHPPPIVCEAVIFSKSTIK